MAWPPDTPTISRWAAESSPPNPLFGAAGLDPLGVESGGADGFTGLAAVEVVQKEAVTGVDGAIGGLHDGGVVEGTGAFGAGVEFEAAVGLPGSAFVVGEGECELVAAAFGVVIDEEPAAVFEGLDFEAGAGVVEIGVGGHGPGFAVVA